MLTTVILYAAMGALLGVEHYNDMRAKPEMSHAEAIVAGLLLGVLWFPFELCGAAHRVWEQVS